MVASASEHETRSRPDLPHTREKRHRYSILRGLNLIADGKALDGLEGETQSELARRRSAPAKGLLVPWTAPVERRGLDTTTGGGGMAVIRPQGVLFDVLRPKLALARLGADIRDFAGGGGSSAVLLPVKVSAANVSWVGDTFTPVQSNMTVGGTPMAAKTVTTYTDVSRRLLTLANTPSYEDLVIDDLMTSIAVAIDAAALNGSGQGNVPLGLMQYGTLPYIVASGGSANGNAPTYADMCNMEAKIGIVNGDSPAGARIGLVTSPQGRNALRQADMGTASGRKVWHAKPMMIDGELRTVETVLGYPAVATTNIPANLTMGSGTGLTCGAMGNFADMLINLFTAVDLIVNPYRQSADGNVRITALQDVDVALRHKDSFCLSAGWICPTIST